jgi:hypothetical protein
MHTQTHLQIFELVMMMPAMQVEFLRSSRTPWLFL